MLKATPQMMFALVLCSAFCHACVNPIDKSANEFWDNPLNDHDGDGLTEQDGDCDDRNDEILGPSEWFVDGDDDGYGDPSQGVLGCLNDLLAEPEAPVYVSNDDDCNDGDAAIHPNNARYEADDLCVVDADGDGYGDAIPPVSADSGNDCDDTDALVYPGYNNEPGVLCILDADGDGFGQQNAPQPYDSGTDCNDADVAVSPNRREFCDLVDNDCNGVVDDAANADAPVWYADADGDGFGALDYPLHACPNENGLGPDGYVANFNDCDDGDAGTHPYQQGVEGGVELCDTEGRDENCDGLVNDPSASDALIWYQDADGDGHGSLLINQRRCFQPTGYVLDNSDCNDAEANANPSRVESCDFIDNDCDGTVDESDAVDAMSYYFDGDNDGFGNPAFETVACPINQPPTHVANGADCDDGDVFQNPMSPESCNGEDDNCDGVVDEDNGTDPALGSPTWYVDLDGDLFGDETQAQTACLQPVGYVAAAGDCNDADPMIHPDADERCTATIDENCDGDPIYGVPTADLNSYYPDSDGDTYGNPTFVIRICEQPQNYVENADDCDDTDYYVHPLDLDLHDGEYEDDGVTPYEHRERCNGKVDLCENDLLGNLTPLDDELDDDGDGFVECAPEVETIFWAHPTQVVQGGGDCDDAADHRYPNADERCNGQYEDCDALALYGGVPPDESDDDGDCFVECDGFDANQWEGDPHTCSYRDPNGVVTSETSVVGGGDCNDASEYTHVGAAPLTNPDACLTDFDGDGLSDRSWDLCPSEMSYTDARYLLQGSVEGAKLTVRSAADVTGDGVPDLLYDLYGRGSLNRVRILDGTAFSSQTPVLDQDAWTYGIDPTTYESDRLGFINDVDGDGVPEVLVGQSDYGADDEGIVALYAVSDFVAHPDVETTPSPVATFTGLPYDRLYSGGSGGDVNGDGYGDLLLYNALATVNFVTVPTVHLIDGASTISQGPSFTSPFSGVYNFRDFNGGRTLNLDGDDLPDYQLSVTDDSCGRCGSAYFFYGANLVGGPTTLTRSEADLAVQATSYRHYFAVVGTGDVDGDGLDDVLTKESIAGMGYHVFLAASLNAATSTLSLNDADISILGGDVTSTKFFRSVGDLDNDGLDDVVMGWAGTLNGVYNADYASVFFGSTLLEALEDAQLDTGLSNGGPVTFDVRDADFVFPDVTGAVNIGDLDLDGLGDLLLTNGTFNYAELEGGLNAIFSACEN